MAARIFCHAAMRQLRLACNQIPLRQGSALWCRQTTVAVAGQHQPFQRLHVKVYDKDAGLEAQREGNKLGRTSDEEFENKATTAAERSRKRVGSFIDRRVKEPQVAEINETQREISNAALEADDVNTDDADTFGNAKLIEDEDEGDREEEQYISRPTRRMRKLSTQQYAFIIKEHLNAHRLKEAIAVLEQRMLKEDRAKPEGYIYNLLISGCAKEGYTRKAFSLFTRMRQRGLKVTGGTYTSLFNACANAPSAADGLAQANRLRETMLEKGYEPNVKNYNAMIKAYGRCGDVQTAYLLVDEMMERSLELTGETFNFLLQACASDKEFGFRHCLLTWHKMMQWRIRPDYYTFHTMLRCVRDCGFGDLQSMQQVLQQILQHSQKTHLNAAKVVRELEAPMEQNLEVETAKQQPTTEEQHLQVTNEATHLELPNLLSAQPHLGSLVSLSEVKQPHERFLLLGGIISYLELMKQHKVTPDIETFTTMLDIIPPTNAAEKQILTFIRRIGLKADIDFFNVLIKKRSMRFDYEGAKEVLGMIRTAGLHPDIVTYGVLALGCQTQEAARELLETMRSSGVRMNIQILGAMLRQGCAQKAFPYVTEIMQITLEEHIKPNDIFLRHLHNFYNQCARAIDARHPYTKSKHFKQAHAKFCDKLRLYHEEQGIAGLKLDDAIKKIKERPYQQYKEESIDGIEPLKNEKQARKQKLRKYIKKIKIENLRGDDEPSTKPQRSIE